MTSWRQMLFIFVLLTLSYFWFTPKNDVVAEKTVRAVEGRSLKIIEERIQQYKVESSTVLEKLKKPEKSCWDRIRDQYQSNPDYLSQSHLHMNEIVGSWFYLHNKGHKEENIQESSPQGQLYQRRCENDS